MSATLPLLSIVIPSRNRCAMASEALKSAFLPLPFTVEVILSDNASTDETPSLQSLFPTARYIRHNETIPMADHWNECVNEARGKYIKLLCDDDWLIPGALAREVYALESNTELSICASARFEILAGHEPVKKGGSAKEQILPSSAIYWKMLLSENFIGPPSAVTFRKASFCGFPPKYTYASDWAAWILLSEQGSLMLLPEAGANFRLHDSNLTAKAVSNDVDFFEVQALRYESLKRLKGWRRWVGHFFLACIFSYRFSRRIARYLVNKNLTGLATFLRKVFRRQHEPPPSPYLSTK